MSGLLFDGYEKVLTETRPAYAEYARQGFWQLLAATLLTLVVIALGAAPRRAARDRTLVRAALGTLCVLTLVVVVSALRRMELYVDAYGLTRLRVSAAGIELWFGVVILLIMAAEIFGGRRLPRAVVASAGAAVLCFGPTSPDALIAPSNRSPSPAGTSTGRDGSASGRPGGAIGRRATTGVGGRANHPPAGRCWALRGRSRPRAGARPGPRSAYPG